MQTKLEQMYEQRTGVRIYNQNNEWTICPKCGRSHYGLIKPLKDPCSKICRQESNKRKMRQLNPKIPVSKLRGAISELRVATDLMEKGYEVFLAASPYTSCDLIVIKNGLPARIEVKTARYSGPKKGINSPLILNKFNYEILALVLSDKIKYKPALETIFGNENNIRSIVYTSTNSCKIIEKL